MDSIERLPWVNYLEGDVIWKDVEGVGRVYQVIVRIQASGLQAVVKARDKDRYSVAFAGAVTLSGLSAKVRDLVLQKAGKWREDKYPPT